MKMCGALRTFAIAAAMFGAGLVAGREADGGVEAAAEAPTAAQLKRVLGFLESAQAGQRQAAFKACRERGEEFKRSYLKLLDEARLTHAGRLEEVARSQLGDRSAVGETLGRWNDWKALAEPALEFVLTDHNKDNAKFAEMDNHFAAASKAWDAVLNAHRRLGRTGGNVLRTIDDAMIALREIHLEMAWCAPDEYYEDEVTDLAYFQETLSLQGRFAETIGAMEEIGSAVARLTDAHAANQAQRWASPAQKDFARLLNDRRAALGLRPLLLDEKLSRAATDHSKEMAAMGYFSHTSPVEENKTFGMRARNAGFTGSAGGECIFNGSASPAAAERGWWYSDGHRLINYSRGPNVLGIGPSGSMWTLLVGSAR